MKFHLHSVLLMALDVVKGPYLSCFAPVNPFEKKSFDQLGRELGDANRSCGCSGDGLYISTSASRFDAFSDVFVPRSEFCRRVVSLLEAESGLLYLFYPEEISGLHYQRKTLRYTLCFAFAVDTKLTTAAETSVERLLRPYSFTLTRIMEGLREAELRYGYVSHGLLCRSPAVFPNGGECQQQKSSQGEPTAQLSRIDLQDTNGGEAAETLGAVTSTSASFLASGDDVLSRSTKGTPRINVFLAPSPDSSRMQWTALDTLMKELFTFLRTSEPEVEVKCPWPWAAECTVSLRLCETFSLRVGHQAPPHLPHRHTLDKVPVPVAPYIPGVFEHVDLVVHDVFKAVDGRRTINQIVQALAAQCSQQDDGDELLQRQGRILSPVSSQCAVHPVFPPVPHHLNPSGSRSAPEVEGPALLSPSSTVNFRGAVNTSQASSGLLSPRTAADVRLASPLPVGGRSTSCTNTVGTGALSKALQAARCASERPTACVVAHNPASMTLSCCRELELLVLEALQQLEAHNYVKIIRPVRTDCPYLATKALHRVMFDRNHPARRLLGIRMLRMECAFHQEREQCADCRKALHNRRRCPEVVLDGGCDLEDTTTVVDLVLPPALVKVADIDVSGDGRGMLVQQRCVRCERPKDKTLPSSTSLKCSSASDSFLEGTSSYDEAKVFPSMVELPTDPEVAYTERQIDTATAAALCALGKFTGSTIITVRKLMRSHPQWSAAFSNWEDSCCKALVEIALINSWLVEQ